MISLRTKDQVTDAAAGRLFALARSPNAMLRLSDARIARTIYPAGFYRVKAGQILGISRALLARHGGRVPADRDALMALPGVGLKTANLVLGRALGVPSICVDVHVHRISNRLGLVRTRTPEETEAALRRVLARRLWVRWNGWLVGYGQRICQPVSPWCSRCRLRPQCPRRGVKRSR
ncbi:MAG: endonuclease III [Candidatus Coatesbacteria bacterium]